jgi:hypothetical protein
MMQFFFWLLAQNIFLQFYKQPVMVRNIMFHNTKFCYTKVRKDNNKITCSYVRNKIDMKHLGPISDILKFMSLLYKLTLFSFFVAITYYRIANTSSAILRLL